jgi:hypothetical protein
LLSLAAAPPGGGLVLLGEADDVKKSRIRGDAYIIEHAST